MLTKPVLTQSDVESILAAAKQCALENGWNVSIAVSDDGGHLLGFLRLDGASPFTSRMALEKARTAAFGRKDSKHYEQAVRERPAFLSAPTLLGMIEGGVAIMVDGWCVGAVGVSGVKSEQDASIAKAGIDALLAALEREPLPPSPSP